MNFSVFYIPLIAVIMLAGCGGDDGPNGPYTNFEDSADTIFRLTAEMFSGDLVEIQNADLPTSGTASFSGPIEIAEYTGTSAVGYLIYGTLNLDTDFRANTVEGDAHGFISVDINNDSGSVLVENLYGTLDITGGKIGPYVDDSFENARMTGSLDGYDFGYVDIKAELNGSFYSYGGNNPDVVIGQGEGTSDSGSGKNDVYIIFFAE